MNDNAVLVSECWSTSPWLWTTIRKNLEMQHEQILAKKIIEKWKQQIKLRLLRILAFWMRRSDCIFEYCNKRKLLVWKNFKSKSGRISKIVTVCCSFSFQSEENKNISLIDTNLYLLLQRHWLQQTLQDFLPHNDNDPHVLTCWH